MKKQLMDLLACPMCHSDLKLDIKEESEIEINTGSMYCEKCKEAYPIQQIKLLK